jgi:hypothetical protein
MIVIRSMLVSVGLILMMSSAPMAYTPLDAEKLIKECIKVGDEYYATGITTLMARGTGKIAEH